METMMGGSFKNRSVLEICDFETEKDISKWEKTDNVLLERSTEHVTKGKYSMKVTFLSKEIEQPFLTLKYPNYSTKDFSKYEYLLMDIFYSDSPPGAETNMRIGSMDFCDSQGRKRPGYVSLAISSPGKTTTAKIPLFLGIAQFSDKFKFSFSDVATFSIMVGKPKKDFVLFIDNIRLIPRSLPSEKKSGVEKISPVSLEERAHFRSLNIIYLGEKGNNRGQYKTSEVLLNNQVNFDTVVPSSLKELKKYDIVVFDNFSIKNLTSSRIKYIKEFYDEGGAVVMLGGRNSFAGTDICPGYKNTPIEDILPVKLITPGMHKVCCYLLKLNIEKPEHPIMKGLSWIDELVFFVSDGDTEDVDGYTRGIRPKDGIEVLVSEPSSKVPLIVLGERSLVFNLEPRLINYYFSYDFWERFIIQSFNYLAKDKDKVILAKIDIPSVLPLDSEVIEGKIYAVNLANYPQKVKGEVKYLSHKKRMEFNIESKQVKETNFSLPTSPLKIGNHFLFAEIESPNSEALSKEFSVESGLSLITIFPVRVVYNNEEIDLEITIKNTNPETWGVRLEVWVQKEKHKVKNIVKEDIKVESKKEQIFKYTFKLNIQEDAYQLFSYLYFKDKLLAKTATDIRIIKKPIPFLKRDIDFRIRGDSFAEKDVLPSDKLLSLEEDIGLQRSDEFSMELIGSQLIYPDDVIDRQFPYTWKDYIAALHKLYQHKISFVIAPFNFNVYEVSYEKVVKILSRMVKLAYDIGKDYFIGLRISESCAIPDFIASGYALFREKETNLEKVDAFIEVVKRTVRDIELPKDKILFLDVSLPIPHEWLFACGENVVVGQAFLPIVPVELTQSIMRGMAKSFSKWWEWEITRWPFVSSSIRKKTPSVYFDPKTGRATPTLKQVPLYFFGLPWGGREGFAGDIHKMYLVSYYQGAKSINAYSENPYEKTQKEAINKFKEFVRNNPRCEEIVSSIAVVKSKGSFWLLPWDVPNVPSRRGTKKPLKKEEKEFLYLNIFFPGFSDDAVNPKYWWTGTPYGAVDLIYPQMRLSDIKKYNSIIFLGYNRMNSVREDFLDDLINYVNNGGTILLSVDQIRNCQDRIEEEKLADFLGVRIEDHFPFPPPKKAREFIEVLEETDFKLERKTYPIREEKVPIHKATPKGAEVIAADKEGNPVLLLNKYGKGYIFFFTTPTLSLIPPTGKSSFISDVIDKITRFKPLPISISPERDDVEFLISKTEDKEATIFIINHGEEDWSGDIIINLKTAGLSSEIANNIKAKIGTGYEVKEVSPEIKRDGDNLIISGITLSGDSEDFISYRQASFAYLRLGVK